MSKSAPRAFLCLCLAAATSACATSRIASDETRTLLRGARLVGAPTTRDPSMSLMGPVGGILTVLTVPLGAVAIGAYSIVAGNKFKRDVGLDDPAGAIRDQLGARFEASLSARYAGVEGVSSETFPPQVSGGASTRSFALDVQTVVWNLHYFAFSGGRYRLFYRADMKLVEVDRSLEVARGTCLFTSPEGETYDTFAADGARRLKEELSKAATYCVDEIWNNSFGLPPPVAP